MNRKKRFENDSKKYQIILKTTLNCITKLYNKLNLVHKYLAGECDPEEKRLIEIWISKHPDNSRFVNSLQKIWDVTPQDEIEVDVQKAWEHFQNRKRSANTKHKVLLQRPELSRLNLNQDQRTSIYQKRSRNMQVTLKIVAVAALILMTFLAYNLMPGEFYSSKTDTAEIIIETERGERRNLILSDGTQVNLNAESKLIISSEFPNPRSVYLDGEAYFDVETDLDNPFVVNSVHMVTKVLGTRFGIRAFENETLSYTVVEEGEVMVGYRNNTEQGQVLLQKNKMAKLQNEKSASIDIVYIDDLTKYLGWKNGQLVFHNTPFQEVIQNLERWYNIDIEIEDTKMLSNELTATFEDEPLSEVLDVIALLIGGKYSIEGRSVYFKK